jgi:hypothetical protein
MTKSLMALVVVASSLFCACKTYLIDRESPNISDPQPDASVGLTPRCSERYRCGYVNREGRFVIAPVYKMVKPFYEGLSAVYKEDSGWGVIDPGGNYVVQTTFASIGPYSEGLAAACPSDKNLYQWVYIDRAGKTAIELKYKVEEPFPFHNGKAWVRCPFLFSSQMKQIDTNGRVLRVIYPR